MLIWLLGHCASKLASYNNFQFPPSHSVSMTENQFIAVAN